MSTRATIGECSISKTECATNQGFQSLIPNENTTSDFCYYIAQTKKKEMITKASGSTFLEISNSEIKHIRVRMPKISEQKHIADFLSKLDCRIEKQRQLVEALKSYKRGALSKLFPQKGETAPAYRFAGFTEPWEQRKVSDVCSISTGKSNTQDKVEDGAYPFYVRSLLVERSNRYLFDEEAVLTVGDGVGTGKVFHYVNGKYDLHQRVYRMYGFSENILARYFYYYFSTHFYGRVMSMTAKTSVDSVRYEMIADMDIVFPRVEEQKKICSYFGGLDYLITLHQHKLEDFNALRSGMLQQLFI